ncbi:MAG: ABC transporter permease [Mycobacteriales bacterium]
MSVQPRDRVESLHGAPPGHATVPVGDLPLEVVTVSSKFFGGFWPTIREIWGYRELLGQLVRKELKVKYKDSVLGFLWTLLRPLLQLVVYSLAIGYFLGNSKNIPGFGVYLFTGLVAWTLFGEIIGGCTGSIVGNGALIGKVYFPRELFPLSVVGAAIVNFGLQLIVLLAAYVVTWSWPKPSNLLLVPVALIALVVFSLALGLVLAAANVYLRDMTYLVEVAMLLWFWMTPIVYDWTKVRTHLVCQGGTTAPNGTACQVTDNHLLWVLQVYLANPMADVVLAFQRALWPGGLTAKGRPFYYSGDLYLRLGVVIGICLVLLWLAQRVFARAQGNFAQEL